MKIGMTTLRRVGNSYYIRIGKKITEELGMLEGREMVIIWESGSRKRIMVVDPETFKEKFSKVFEWG